MLPHYFCCYIFHARLCCFVCRRAVGPGGGALLRVVRDAGPIVSCVIIFGVGRVVVLSGLCREAKKKNERKKKKKKKNEKKV